MGYLRITRPDGTEIFYGDDYEDELEIECCDVCNEPRPSRDLTNVGGDDDATAIWQCSKCHGVNKS